MFRLVAHCTLTAVDKSPEDILRERFAQMEIGLDAFSSLRYVGIQTTHPPTNYKILQNVLNMEIENTTVRSPRSLEIVYKAIEVSGWNALNHFIISISITENWIFL